MTIERIESGKASLSLGSSLSVDSFESLELRSSAFRSVERKSKNKYWNNKCKKLWNKRRVTIHNLEMILKACELWRW